MRLEPTVTTPAHAASPGSRPPTRHGYEPCVDDATRPDALARCGPLERLALNGLKSLMARMGNPPVGFELWNGVRLVPNGNAAVGVVTIKSRRTLLQLLRDSSGGFGEAFTHGLIDVTGDLVGVLAAFYHGLAHASRTAGPRRSWWPGRARGRSHSLESSRDSVYHHYDLGNAFYRLWLDEQLLYTCAYFPDRDVTLEAAQVAKMDHVCRKLRLRPDEMVIEAGCGWGALALHMARNYGVRVRAYNVSREQMRYARERARDLQLQDRVEFVEEDYRHMTGEADAFVSVGMLEHVGAENYALLGRAIDRVLKPGGRGLIHSIGRNSKRPMDTWIERRIFPGAYPPSLREMMDVLEPADFSVLDVENLRMHYALTVRHWLQRFDAAADQVAQLFDARFVRMWRLYLAGSVAAFEAGDMQLFQILFARGDSNDIPWTRADLYASDLYASERTPGDNAAAFRP